MEAIVAKIEAYSPAEADGQASDIIQGISYLPGWAEKNFQVRMRCRPCLRSTCISRVPQQHLVIHESVQSDQSACRKASSVKNTLLRHADYC